MGIDAAFGKVPESIYDAMSKSEEEAKFLKELHEAQNRESEGIKF